MQKLKTMPDRGFTLYYAVLFGSIILAIGASMLGITLKEFLLSSSLQQSEFSFFAADTGTECALYWDLSSTTPSHGNVFPVCNNNQGCNFLNPNTNTYGTMTPGVTPLAVSSPGTIQCNGAAITQVAPFLQGTANSATTTFSYNMGPGGTYCTVVAIGKQIQADGSIYTTIFARGYNLPCNSTSPRLLERAIITTYPYPR